MNDTTLSKDQAAGAGEDRHTALFAQLVMQQTNLALTLLGKLPHPETGEVTRDLDAARLFIDQLEMLEVKTRGNLTREENRLLQQSLMSLRLAYVEAVETPAATASAPGGSGQATAGDASAKAGATDQQPAEQEPRKRFTKSYGA